MLRERLNAYFALPSIEDNEEQLRVWVLRRMILFGICTNTIAVAFAISNPRFLLELMVAYGLLFGALLLLEYCVRHHKVRAVAWGLALLAWAWLVLMAALQGPFGAQGGFRYTTIAIVLATFILGTGPGFLFLALTALAGLAFWLLGPATEGMMLLRVDSDQEQLLSYMLVLAMLYVLIATGRAVLLQSLRQTQTAQAESEARQVSLAQAYADVERQVQERTQELEATLRQQEDLLHIVAHDLKNPLSGLALTLDLGSGSMQMDMAELQLESLSIDGGSGVSELLLPAGTYTLHYDIGSGATTVHVGQSGAAELHLDGGSGRLTLVVPAGVPVYLEVESGTGNLNLDDRFKQVDERDGVTIWETRGFDPKAEHITIYLDLGSGSVSSELP